MIQAAAPVKIWMISNIININFGVYLKIPQGLDKALRL